MEDFIRKRILYSANLMISKRLTVRQIAKEIGYSKTTVHKDLAYRLPEVNRIKAKKVREILDEHIRARAKRGGEAVAARWKSR